MGEGGRGKSQSKTHGSILICLSNLNKSLVFSFSIRSRQQKTDHSNVNSIHIIYFIFQTGLHLTQKCHFCNPGMKWKFLTLSQNVNGGVIGRPAKNLPSKTPWITHSACWQLHKLGGLEPKQEAKWQDLKRNRIIGQDETGTEVKLNCGVVTFHH